VSAFLLFGACGVPEYGFDEKDASIGGNAGQSTGGGGAAGDDASAGSSGTAGSAGSGGSGGCTNDQECSGGLVCDTATETCVECLAGKGCPVGTYCKDQGCVTGCLSDEDCVPSGTKPDDDGGVQLEGGSTADDAGGDGGEVKLTCDTTKNLCVGCVQDWQCPIGTICDGASETCVPGCIDSAGCPAERECCNNDCVNLQVHADHCGGCGLACAPDNATGRCEATVCLVDSCDDGFKDCDGAPGNGCEAELSSDPKNCNACGTVCSVTNANAKCVSGVCGMDSCKDGFQSCDGNDANGCEVNVLNDKLNCNFCGNVCGLLNASSNCQAGVCTVASCNSGFKDCNASMPGCETNLQTDINHCGDCNKPCQFDNAAASCSGGQCQLGACAAPWENCDAIAANGCEANKNIDVNHCGGCGKACNKTNGTAACDSGSCTISCNSGFANCDGSVTNGCEINTNTSLAHCGGCSKPCDMANASESCVSGVCTLGTCTTGFGNCDNVATNGCETNILTSNDHCGACSKKCLVNEQCKAGVCESTTITCPTGYLDCNGNPADGCEVNKNTDVKNCGSCGNECTLANGTGACVSGSCQIASCSTGFRDCDGSYANGCEKNINTDVNHCGACNNACSVANGTAKCTAGSCGVNSCNPGYSDCDNLYSTGCEKNLNTDVTNCGGCGNVCTNPNGTTKCTSGVCDPTCQTNFRSCDGNPNNGCETPVTTLTNCGACGVPCSPQNATGTCTTGSCQVASCNTGWENCDGSPTNGCEVNKNTNVNHCGACNNACTFANAAASCSGGSCQLGNCNSGWGNCDGNATNGCETNTNSNASHCGQCNNACTTGQTCSSGTCSGGGSCNPGYLTCGSNNCSCQGEACCGNSCQVKHNTGLATGGSTIYWYDCTSYGTYNSVQAMRACVAFCTALGGSAANCIDSATGCSSGPVMVCNKGKGAVWGYTGSNAGRVESGLWCPTTSSGRWDP
jgi:hypothetical protein